MILKGVRYNSASISKGSSTSAQTMCGRKLFFKHAMGLHIFQHFGLNCFFSSSEGFLFLVAVGGPCARLVAGQTGKALVVSYHVGGHIHVSSCLYSMSIRMGKEGRWI